MGALSKANEATKEAAGKDKEAEKAEKDSAGRSPADQVKLSQAGEKEAEKEQKTVVELPDAAAYNKDGSLIPQAQAAAAAVSFSATA